jgi:transposase
MARQRIGMKKIRDVVRLKSTTTLSDRQIARALNISRPVVAKYWQGFVASGVRLEQIQDMPDSDLLRLIEPPKRQESSAYRQLAQYFPYFVLELKRTGVTLQRLWEEYKQKHPEGLQYSQFCYHFQRWRENDEVRMHLEHRAGDKMFVDYAGQTMSYVDHRTGALRSVEVFVAVLGSSGLTYVEASESQKKEQWIRSNERAIRYMGGCTAAIVPDNLKSAVTRSDPYDPEINPEFAEFAEYYGTVILPARVRKARDKALVENAVGLVYQRIYAPLRNRSFFSLQELNEAIWQRLEIHNNTPLQRLKISRRELFAKTERSVLTPLPPERFPLKSIKWVTVQFNYHVELREDLHYYSVPHYLYRKEPKTKVKMVYDDRVVALYYDNIRITQHRRDRSPNGYSTHPHHMPSSHRWYAQWSPSRFTRWAKSFGEEVEKVITAVLARRKHPEQAYKVCLGILNLGKKYGNERLLGACAKANEFGIYSLKWIEAQLKRTQEEEWLQPELDLAASIPAHKNIRGSGYYT